MAAIKRTKADFDAIGWLMCEQADAPHIDTLAGLIPFGDVEMSRPVGLASFTATGQGASVWRAEVVRRATAAQKAAAKAKANGTTTEPPPAMAESRKSANDRPAPVGPGAGRA